MPFDVLPGRCDILRWEVWMRHLATTQGPIGQSAGSAIFWIGRAGLSAPRPCYALRVRIGRLGTAHLDLSCMTTAQKQERFKNHSKTFGAELASAVADVRAKTSERKSASGPECVPGET